MHLYMISRRPLILFGDVPHRPDEILLHKKAKNTTTISQIAPRIIALNLPMNRLSAVDHVMIENTFWFLHTGDIQDHS